MAPHVALAEVELAKKSGRKKTKFDVVQDLFEQGDQASDDLYSPEDDESPGNNH